jgi:hypothetical protein
MKKLWAWPAQAAAWLCGMILLFVVEPPRLVVEDPPSTTARFVQFALAIVIGIIFAAFSAAPGRGTARRAAWASGGFLAAAMLLFGTYLYFSDQWTCRYDSGRPLVIGESLKPLGRAYLHDNPEYSGNCSQMISDFAGRTDDIWPLEERSNRRLILIGLFTFVVFAFALAAVFMIQALAVSRKQPEEHLRSQSRRKR